MSAITCIAFTEFLSALYAGDLDGPGLNQLKNYAAAFMTAEYTADRLAVLYECFRHKVAHLALPHAVFDTDTKRNVFRDQPPELLRASGSRPQLRSLTARLAHRKVRASAVY